MLTASQAIAQIKSLHGLNQSEIAQKLGCSQATVSNAKRGMAKFNPAQVELLKELAGADVAIETGAVGTQEAVVTPAKPQETDAEMWKRIQESFEDLEACVKLVGKGKAHSLVTSGAPGLGKTHTIESTLKAMGVEFVSIKGSGSASSFYRKLYENRNKLILLDDCDSLLLDEETLNLLKAALDTGKGARTVSWLKQNKSFEADDIPTSFEFEGQMIVITNLTFEGNGRIHAHMDAFLSRSLHFDMKMSTRKEVFTRLKQLAPVILKNMDPLTQGDVMNFVEDNMNNFKRLSIRELVKLTELVDPEVDWQRLAKRIFCK